VNFQVDGALIFGFSAGLLAGWASIILVAAWVVSRPKKK
jgi:hypothetical protein